MTLLIYDPLFFLQANSDLDEVTINVAGTYKIEFTTLMQSTDQKLFRTEIFKVQYFWNAATMVWGNRKKYKKQIIITLSRSHQKIQTPTVPR